MPKILIGAALAAALALGAPAAWAQQKAADKATQTFIKNAIEGNLAEIQMGELAQKNGASEGVKSFGQMLHKDHSDANQKAMTIAKDLGVTPPNEPNAKQKAEYNRMSKLTGARFDSEFAKMMVADHKKDISEFQRESKKNDETGNFAKETLPTLQKHLQTAQDLERGAATTGRSR
jgi:putative membrane protein